MRLIDTSLWIDLFRARSPRALRQFVAGQIDDSNAFLAEPVVFEVLRQANGSELRHVSAQFETLPLLVSPGDLWSKAASLGRACRHHGVTAGSLDLLIAAVAIHHDAEVVTFDHDFDLIGAVAPLRVRCLPRPAV